MEIVHDQPEIAQYTTELLNCVVFEQLALRNSIRSIEEHDCRSRSVVLQCTPYTCYHTDVSKVLLIKYQFVI